MKIHSFFSFPTNPISQKNDFSLFAVNSLKRTKKLFLFKKEQKEGFLGCGFSFFILISFSNEKKPKQ